MYSHTRTHTSSVIIFNVKTTYMGATQLVPHPFGSSSAITSFVGRPMTCNLVFPCFTFQLMQLNCELCVQSKYSYFTYLLCVMYVLCDNVHLQYKCRYQSQLEEDILLFSDVNKCILMLVIVNLFLQLAYTRIRYRFQ